MKTKKKQTENVFLQHQIKIAKKTINMPDAILGVMGGMTKNEAKEILKKNEDPCENCDLILDCKDCSIFRELHE